jgi:hypothetical protein
MLHTAQEVEDRQDKDQSNKDDEEHGDKEHGDREHGDKDHGGKEHGVDKDHDDKDHGDKDHGDKDHGDKDHGDIAALKAMVEELRRDADEQKKADKAKDQTSKKLQNQMDKLQEDVTKHEAASAQADSKATAMREEMDALKRQIRGQKKEHEQATTACTIRCSNMQAEIKNVLKELAAHCDAVKQLIIERFATAAADLAKAVSLTEGKLDDIKGKYIHLERDAIELAELDLVALERGNSKSPNPKRNTAKYKEFVQGLVHKRTLMAALGAAHLREQEDRRPATEAVELMAGKLKRGREEADKARTKAHEDQKAMQEAIDGYSRQMRTLQRDLERHKEEVRQTTSKTLQAQVASTRAAKEAQRTARHNAASPQRRRQLVRSDTTSPRRQRSRSTRPSGRAASRSGSRRRAKYFQSAPSGGNRGDGSPQWPTERRAREETTRVMRVARHGATDIRDRVQEQVRTVLGRPERVDIITKFGTSGRESVVVQLRTAATAQEFETKAQAQGIHGVRRERSFEERGKLREQRFDEYRRSRGRDSDRHRRSEVEPPRNAPQEYRPQHDGFTVVPSSRRERRPRGRPEEGVVRVAGGSQYVDFGAASLATRGRRRGQEWAL